MIAVLPFTNQFATLIMRWIPAGDGDLTRRLEPSLLNQPHVAIESVLATLNDLATVVFSSLATLLESNSGKTQALARLDEAEQAVLETRHYLNQINATADNERLLNRNLMALHVLDHLARLIVRSRKEDRLKTARTDPELAPTSAQLAKALAHPFGDVKRMNEMNWQLERLWLDLDERIEPYRRQVLAHTAWGDVTTDQAIDRLDAIRWLRRAGYHAWRIVYHLAAPAESPEREDEATRLEQEPEELD